MDIPSLFMIPSAVSSGKVHSVFPNSTDADFDFNRDSDATRVNSEGLIERVGYYGSELVTNGGFDDSSFWSVGQYWSIANGLATRTVVGSELNYSISRSSLLVIGKTYRVDITVHSVQSGNVKVVLGATNGEEYTEAGTYTFVGTCTTNTNFKISPSNDFNGSIDSVSVKEVTGDRARLNYEIEGGLVNTKPSLLLEPQRTNLITYSEDLTATGWSSAQGGTGISPIRTANYGIAPDGSQTATRVQFDLNGGTSSSDISYIAFYYTATGTATTNSIYMKSLSGTADVRLRCGSSFKEVDVTTDWQRFDVTNGSTSDRIQVLLYGHLSSQSADLLIWGVQAEAGSYPTSYIPTNGSTQTRAAETCNGAGTSSIFESSEGILYCEIAALADDGNIKHISLSDGSTNNRIIIAIDEYNDVRFYYQGTGGSVLVSFSNQSLLFSKIAIRYKSGNFCYYINGAKVGVNTSAISFSGLNDLSFNNPYQGGTSPLYGKIRDIRVYNTKEMTDSEVDILLTKITS